MKISFFIGSMYGGGAERVISILANHYCKKGWDVDIVLLLDARVGYKLEEKIKLVDFSPTNGSYYKNLLAWLKKIRVYVKKEKPDRIVSFIGRINVLVLTACIGLRIPVIVSERNDPKHDGRSRIMISITNIVYRSARKIVFQTQYEKGCFSKRLEKKSVVIPNPIFTTETHTCENKYALVTAGRLLPQKNHAMLIDAVKELKSEYSQISLHIYGEGLLKNTLKEKVASLLLSNNVFLCGNVNDLHKRISSAGVFVMTSEFEGLSNALIEAMMIGLPCITTNYSGVEEVIQHEVNGLVVPRGDVFELVNAIKRLLEDDELRMKLARNAKETSQQYRYTVIIKRWEDAIEEIYK